MDNALSIDTGLVRKILTEFIRSEIGRAGFSRAVVNLSGGIDSAVSFALAAGALGPENVLAVRLPYKTSSADFARTCPTADRPVRLPVRDHPHHRDGGPADRTSTRKCQICAKATSWHAPA